MWEEYVQVQLILGIISVVVGTIVVGINVKCHHLLRTVYKGFRIANGFSIVILVIIKLFNLLQVNCSLLKFQKIKRFVYKFVKKYAVGIEEISEARWKNIEGFKNFFGRYSYHINTKNSPMRKMSSICVTLILEDLNELVSICINTKN